MQTIASEKVGGLSPSPKSGGTYAPDPLLRRLYVHVIEVILTDSVIDFYRSLTISRISIFATCMLSN